MTPAKLAEREHLGPKRKHKLVDTILKTWVERGVVRDLYQAFKATMEKARTQSTTKYGR